MHWFINDPDELSDEDLDDVAGGGTPPPPPPDPGNQN